MDFKLSAPLFPIGDQPKPIRAEMRIIPNRKITRYSVFLLSFTGKVSLILGCLLYSCRPYC